MLILVRGLPGTGKSFFSEHFAPTIGAELISSDRVRSDLGLRGHYSQAAKDRVYAEMFRRADSVLSEERDCMLDATFSKQTRILSAQSLARKFAADFFVFEMTADQETIRSRVSKKRKFSEADLNVFGKMKQQYDAVPVDFLKLDSSNSDLEAMTLQAKRYIGYD